MMYLRNYRTGFRYPRGPHGQKRLIFLERNSKSSRSIIIGYPYEGSLSSNVSWSRSVNLGPLKGPALQWHHDGRDGVSNHQPRDCLFKSLFRRGSKITSKLRVTGLCRGVHRWPSTPWIKLILPGIMPTVGPTSCVQRQGSWLRSFLFSK